MRKMHSLCGIVRMLALQPTAALPCAATPTSMLQGGVKLVGPSINCEGAGEGDPLPASVLSGEDDGSRGGRRTSSRGGSTGGDGGGGGGSAEGPLLDMWVPHVQSYAVATDVEGLARLMGHSTAFRCHEVGAPRVRGCGGEGVRGARMHLQQKPTSPQQRHSPVPHAPLTPEVRAPVATHSPPKCPPVIAMERKGRLDAIRSAEVGASAAMLAAGHDIESFQLK
jgi:hypothetical protein